MKAYFTSIAFLYTFFLFAQVPNVLWKKAIGGSDIDAANSIQQTTDKGYIVCGSSSSLDGDILQNKGGQDAMVLKLNDLGTIEWQKNIGGSANDVANCIIQTKDGGYLLVGNTTSNDGDIPKNQGAGDAWVVKFNSNGEIEWNKTFGGSGGDNARTVKQNIDGGYIIGATTNSLDGDISYNHGAQEAWIIKLSALGDLEWEKSFGGNNSDYAFSIDTTTDGGYIFVGYSNSNDGNVLGGHGGQDIWVVKLNALGEQQWYKIFGGSKTEDARCIFQTTDGGYILSASSNSIDGDMLGNKGDYDIWIFKLNENGDLDWKKNYGGKSIDYARSIQPTLDDGYILGNSTFSTEGDVSGDPGDKDAWVFKIDTTGTLLWQKVLGGTSQDDISWLNQDPEGNYFFAGFTSSNNGDIEGNHGVQDAWVVKLGNEVLSNTNTYNLKNASAFYDKNNSTLYLKIRSNQNFTTYEIIDIAGKKVLKNSTSYDSIDVSILSNGIYFLKIEGIMPLKFFKN